MAPVPVLLGYAWFIAASYSPHLDWNLKFHKPAAGCSPDAILGIGFFLPWLFFLLIFLFAFSLGLVVVSHRLRFGLWIQRGQHHNCLAKCGARG